ncbi:CoA-transferase [Chelativorans sp. Marseille-P2723]|uniref:CoA-transferase n=1 Tax=Chelativorans sp. Marseille-P2723 TaxID=2709133 RepID=UPI00156F9CC1|nr:CoA-transferase [Chelativorans sp. Marseille-P2723]
MTEAGFALEELLIARMAKEYRGGRMGVGATILADLSARLAKALYVPDLFLTTISRAAADPQIHAKTFSDEWALDESATMALGWEEMFRLIAHQKLQIWIGSVQIDRFGGSNISVIGDWERPRAQLIGARGIPDDLWGCETLNYHIRKHTPKSFVEKVDFVCGFGKSPDLGSVGVQPAAPGVVISDLGVFDFNGADGAMRVVSLHPGVDFAKVQEMTGFELADPGPDVPVTEAPTAEELHIIRNVIDPSGMRRLESNEATPALFNELWARELQNSKAGADASRKAASC